MRKLGLGIVVVLGVLMAIAVLGRVSSVASTASNISPGSAASAFREEITPDSVILDYGSRTMRMVARVNGKQVHGHDTLWVWAFFTNASVSDGSWSDEAIAVAPELGADSVLTLRAAAPFHWHDNAEVPRRGFHARVFVSWSSAEAVKVRSADRDKNVATMSTVETRQ